MPENTSDVTPETVEVSAEEIAGFAEILDTIQRFVMSLDFRLRNLEALIYAATDTGEAEEPTSPEVAPDPED